MKCIPSARDVPIHASGQVASLRTLLKFSNANAEGLQNQLTLMCKIPLHLNILPDQNSVVKNLIRCGSSAISYFVVLKLQ